MYFNQFHIFFQAIAKVSIKLAPLLDGCAKNRENWLQEEKSKHFQDQCGRENESKDMCESESKDRKMSNGNEDKMEVS